MSKKTKTHEEVQMYIGTQYHYIAGLVRLRTGMDRLS